MFSRYGGLMDWGLGGLEVCCYDVFEQIQSLRCVFTMCLRTPKDRRTFPSDQIFTEIWALGFGGCDVCFYDVFEQIQSLRCVFALSLRTSEGRRTFPCDQPLAKFGPGEGGLGGRG